MIPPLMVISGLAGVGKTALLESLSCSGAAVLDLEGLAGHRGSAFGGLGRPPQPAQSAFDSAVRSALDGFSSGAGPVYVEDEGAFVGSLTVPAPLRAAIEATPVVEVVAPLESRIARLAADYGWIDPELLIRATQRIRRRIGDRVADQAVSQFAAGQPDAAIAALLPHFDSAYRHRWASLARPVLARIAAAPDC
jgi:tRNA 2-selenouridine synthase